MTKNLCLVGATDKRVVAYPLIKALMHLGRTLIVADDGAYRRFDEGYGTNFDFGNSEFIIVPVVNDEVIAEVTEKSSTFEYVLYITTDEIPEGTKAVYIRGIDKGIASEDTLKIVEESEFLEVLFTFDKVLDKKALKITPSIKHYQYLARCEDRKEFVAVTDPAFVSLVTTFFEEDLDLPKATIKKILGQ